jgi:hypothetical protein
MRRMLTNLALMVALLDCSPALAADSPAIAILRQALVSAGGETGIRAARGIPVYCLDLNRPALSHLAATSDAGHPDALSRAPHAPRLVSFSGRLSLGEGPNRVELYPLRGETSERQMMAYLPGPAILYGSNPFQQDENDSCDTIEAVSELVAAVDREHLPPVVHNDAHHPDSLGRASQGDEGTEAIVPRLAFEPPSQPVARQSHAKSKEVAGGPGRQEERQICSVTSWSDPMTSRPRSDFTMRSSR